jgi:tRNA(fMet)-specific endonuclease VapC
MPANGKCLLDTNIIILLLNGDETIQQTVGTTSEFFVPIIAIGELLFGAAKSSRPEQNRRIVEAFARRNSILLCDFAVAKEYGRMIKLLGKPIPENDVWIVAIALRWNLTLVTRDQHFQAVNGLMVEAW